MYDVKNKVVQAEGRMINDGVIQSMLMYLPNLPPMRRTAITLVAP